MKQISFAIALLALTLSIGSCKKTVTQTGTYYVPSHTVCVSGVFPPNTTTETQDVNQADLRQAFGTSGLIFDSTQVTTATLTAINANVTDGDLGDVEQIKVAIKVKGAAGDGTIIAHYDGGSTGAVGTSIPLTLSNVDLKQFMSTSSTILMTVTNKSSGGRVCMSINGGTISITTK
ncbi:MAG: hypothetical protein U0T73_05135 [Chitinophagales bacterium]